MFGAHLDLIFGAVTGLFGDEPIQIGIVTAESDDMRNQSGNVRSRFDTART